MGRDALAMPLHDYQAALYHYAKATRSSEDDDEDALSEGDFDEMLVGMASTGVH
jgi:hypothetical protein